MRSHGKPILAAGCSALLFTLVIAVFWYQDWQYSLPTPRPEALKQPALGMVMSVAEVLPGGAKYDRSRPTAVASVRFESTTAWIGRPVLRKPARRVSFDASPSTPTMVTRS